MSQGKLNIMTYLYAILLVTLVVISFYIIPNGETPGDTGSFWHKYGYVSPPDNALLAFQSTNNVSSSIKNMECHLFKLQSSNNALNQCADSSVWSDTTNFIRVMVLGGFQALASAFDTFGVFKDMVFAVSDILNVPPAIVNLLFTFVTLIVLFSIVMLVFYRSFDV